jgi:hypothetical protein
MKVSIPKMSTDLTRVSIPSVVEPKYDGELVVWKNGVLNNRFGRERVLPFCKDLPDVSLIGELYFETGKKNFYQALSYLKGDSPLLKFVAFGIYNENVPYIEQIKILKAVIQETEYIKVIEGMTAYSHLEIEHYCEHYLDQGYEGSVIKPLNSAVVDRWVKNKPDETIDLCIVGISKKKHAIAVGKVDGTILGHCSLNGKREVAELIGKEKIIGTTNEDYLIEPKYVIEVKHLGVIEGSGHLRSPRISRVREDLGVADAI